MISPGCASGPSEFHQNKPPVPEVQPDSESDDEYSEDERKYRWKLRRLAYGGTGCSHSCVDRFTPYFRKLCKQRKLNMHHVYAYLQLIGV